MGTTMQESLTQNNQKISTLLLYISVVVTVLIYSANERIGQIATTLMPILWLLCLLARVVECRFRVTLSKDLKIMIFLFLVYYLKCKALYYLGEYSTSGLGPARTLHLCLIFYYIGYSTENTERVFDRLLKVFVIITAVVSIAFVAASFSSNFVYWEFRAESATNPTHLAVLIAVVSIILLFYWKPRYKILNIVFIIIALLLLIALLFLHTRTPALSAAACIVYLLFDRFRYFHNRSDVKSAAIVLFGLLILVIVGLSTGMLERLYYELFPKNMDTAITGMEDFDTFSSGRVSIYIDNWMKFLSSPLIGVGNWAYADNFVLHVLGTGGIISAVLLFPIAYYIPLKGAFSKGMLYYAKTQNDYRIRLQSFAAAMAIYFSLVSLAEGSPPLGTGTMVFLPWIIYGMRQRDLDYELSQPS